MERKRAVAAIVEKDCRVLVGKKRSDSNGSLRGEWHFPGEKLEEGESDEEALKRGLREEASLEITVIKFLGFHTTPKGTLVNWYLCRADSEKVIIGSDLEDIRWVFKGEIPDLTSDVVKSRWPNEIKRYLSLNC